MLRLAAPPSLLCLWLYLAVFTILSILLVLPLREPSSSGVTQTVDVSGLA